MDKDENFRELNEALTCLVTVGVNDIHSRYECHLLCEDSKGCSNMFGCQTFDLLKVEGLTFISIKVRFLLFMKYDIFFLICCVKK